MELFSKSDALWVQRVAGVHLFLDKWTMDVVVVGKKGNLLELMQTRLKIDSFDELKKQLSTDLPIILSVEGKGIIHRLFPIENTLNPLLQILPGVKPENFHVQTHPADGENQWISVIRTETLQEIINAFAESGYILYDIIIGPFKLNSIWSLFEIQAEEIHTAQYKITFRESQIIRIDSFEEALMETEYFLEKEKVKLCFLIPYANALTFFTAEPTFPAHSDKLCLPGRMEFLYRKRFRMVFGLALAITFTTLLINYLMFDHYNQELTALMPSCINGETMVIRLNELKKESEVKEALILENNLVRSSRFSYYADKIAASLTSQILLTNLTLCPVKNKIKKDQEIEIDHGIITISGQCSNNYYFNSWLEKLKKESWIKELKIIQFSQDRNENPAVFLINLNI